MVGTVLGNMLIALERLFFLVLGMSCIANSGNIQF